MKNIDLIVSRYKENIDWINKNGVEQLVDNIIVYNKYHDIEPKLYNYDSRESHTYLHHIVENYDNLSDYNIFIQAHPFDHCPDFIAQIKEKRFINKCYHNFTIYAGREDLYCDRNGNPHDRGLPVGEVYETLFEKKMPDVLCFNPCGLFCVTREKILERKKSFYSKCLEMSKNDKRVNYAGHGIGHVFERLWRAMFFEIRD